MVSNRLIETVIIVAAISLFIISGIVLVSCSKPVEFSTTSETMSSDTNNEKSADIEEVNKEKMQISSLAFSNNESIPKKYTCDGENINPPLAISGVPEDAESLVLIVDDPDAPGGTWTHWTVFNIDPSLTDIPENSVPNSSVEGMTDSNNTGYDGPCPPSGTHRYFFRLYAISVKLDLDSSATADIIKDSIKGKTLATAELMGLYKRN